MVKPKEKAQALTSEINGLIRDRRDGVCVYDTKRVEAIEVEIASIRKHGLVKEALELTGMLAGVTGDEDLVRKSFSAALVASGNDVDVRVNYALALDNLHIFGEALQQINEVVPVYPDNLLVLGAAAGIYYNAFCFNEARDILDKLEKLHAADSAPEHLKTSTDAIEMIFSSAGVSPEAARERVEMVARTIRKNGAISHSLKETILGTEVLFEFNLHLDVETVLAIERAVQVEISNQPYSVVDDVLTFGCTPV